MWGRGEGTARRRRLEYCHQSQGDTIWRLARSDIAPSATLRHVAHGARWDLVQRHCMPCATWHHLPPSTTFHLPSSTFHLARPTTIHLPPPSTLHPPPSTFQERKEDSGIFPPSRSYWNTMVMTLCISGPEVVEVADGAAADALPSRSGCWLCSIAPTL